MLALVIITKTNKHLWIVGQPIGDITLFIEKPEQ